jgi:hypothetical protein
MMKRVARTPLPGFERLGTRAIAVNHLSQPSVRTDSGVQPQRRQSKWLVLTVCPFLFPGDRIAWFSIRSLLRASDRNGQFSQARSDESPIPPAHIQHYGQVEGWRKADRCRSSSQMPRRQGERLPSDRTWGRLNAAKQKPG